MKNRIISILLCFVLAFSVCIIPVNADPETTITETDSAGTEAAITFEEKISETSLDYDNVVLVYEVTNTTGKTVEAVGITLYNGGYPIDSSITIPEKDRAKEKFVVRIKINELKNKPEIKPNTTYRYVVFGILNEEQTKEQESTFHTNPKFMAQYIVGNDTDPWFHAHTVGQPIGRLVTPKPPEGYIFTGWYTKSDGGDEIDEETVVTENDTTFYAHYEKLITVTFDANGGTCEKDYIEIVASGTMPTIPDPKREGYKFLGWFTEPDGGGVQIASNDGIPYTENFTLYAHWEKLITVTFDANGGFFDVNGESCEKMPMDISAGKELNLEDADTLKPSRDRHRFLGWFTQPEAGEQKTKIETEADTENFTLYAHWEKILFEDVKIDDWYYDDLKNAYQKGLINGKGENVFEPDAELTIAEVIKIAACMHQMYHERKVTLANGSGENWYQPYVEYARANGIPWDASDYNVAVIRRAAVYILYYALPEDDYKPINTIDSIPDVPVDDVCADEIYTFYRAGIITGRDDRTFAPTSKIQRSEAAAILSRMMDKSKRK